ncbi:MAG TPA: SOS response-associated peptidase [Micropepsaceae bacterium]|jgi:putative SOS response-associated peptidase YedK|nr:SOS response-associated peptidase [Micropepsaceae bacterium]
MCGKFTQMMRWGDLVSLSDLIGASDGPSETVTPMRFATVITLNAARLREAARMRWGLVPPSAKDPNRSPFIHARAETVDRLPTFANAFLHRRGLVAVSTFNEGKEITPSKTEQHVITPKDRKPLAIAVIWERWGEPHGAALESFAMLTVPPNRLIGTITDRMPAIVRPEHWAKWLGEEPASVSELKALLAPFEGDWTMQPEKPPRPKADTPPDPQLPLF